MDLGDFATLNRQLSSLKKPLALDELLQKYKIELFDQNIGPNAIALSNKRKDATILQMREEIKASFLSNIQDDLGLLADVDVGIRKFASDQNARKIVKFVLDKVSLNG